MPAVRMCLCGQPNGISINRITESVSRACGITCYMIRRRTDKICSLAARAPYGTRETDESYVRAGSKGVPPEANCEGCTVPGRRGLSGGRGAAPFQNALVATTYYGAPPGTTKTGPC